MKKAKYKIFDSHAHYDDESFNGDRQEIFEQIKEGGVIGVLNCGSTLYGARTSLRLAEENEFIYAAVGIHPECANEFTPEWHFREECWSRCFEQIVVVVAIIQARI